MESAKQDAETWLGRAVDALGREDWQQLLDQLPVPVYRTDSDGNVTYWNRACERFAGRKPQLGRDRWCVTWRLFTTIGDPLPHDACPMAVAIKQKRAVRGAVAIAERPDGSRVAFRPYPTPLLDAAGQLIGAINLLIDVTREQGPALRGEAERCRRLARGVDDQRTSTILGAMADGYEAIALSLRQS